MQELTKQIRERLQSKGLKVTPQRVIVLETLLTLKSHPTAEEINGIIKEKNPNISIGTIYNILDTLVENNLINRVRTEKDKMRYDAILEKHHHVYDSDSDRIIDFFDGDLDKIIEEYLKDKQIPKFDIHDFKLQITGKYRN